MSDNIYQNIAFDYVDAISDLSKLYKIDACEAPTKKLFNKSKLLKLDNMEDIKFNFKYIENINTRDNDTWIRMIKQFIEFLYTADKCFMYDNFPDKGIKVYTGSEKDKSGLFFHPDNLNIELSIEFEYTEINTPDSVGSLVSFINGYEPEKVTVHTITLHRNYGEFNLSKIQFISTDELETASEEDRMLIDNIKNVVSMMIFECFIDIIDNYAMKLLGVEKVFIKDVIANEGIWVR